MWIKIFKRHKNNIVNEGARHTKGNITMKVRSGNAEDVRLCVHLYTQKYPK